MRARALRINTPLQPHTQPVQPPLRKPRAYVSISQRLGLRLYTCRQRANARLSLRAPSPKSLKDVGLKVVAIQENPARHTYRAYPQPAPLRRPALLLRCLQVGAM